MANPKLEGILPAFPTPTRDDGTVDEAALRRLLQYLLDGGAAGLVPVGGTGEFTALSPEARTQVVAVTAEAADGRVPVVAGVVSPGWAEAVQAGRDFKAAGADAILLITPFYVTPTQAGIRDYFRAYREAVDLPLVFYDIPGRTRIVTEAETLAGLAADRTIVGMKICNTDMHHTNLLASMVDDSFAMLRRGGHAVPRPSGAGCLRWDPGVRDAAPCVLGADFRRRAGRQHCGGGCGAAPAAAPAECAVRRGEPGAAEGGAGHDRPAIRPRAAAAAPAVGGNDGEVACCHRGTPAGRHSLMATAGPPIGAVAAEDDIRIAAGDLHAMVVRIFSALGSGAREAGLVADHLVLANLFGHDSHGISLIPLYVRMAREGRVRPNTRVTTVMDAGALVTLDAGRGFGQATAHEAMECAIARAQAHGSVILALRNSHHVGRIGHWAEQCAAAGLVSVHFVNVLHAPPVVAPYAGSDARLHTNPFAVVCRGRASRRSCSILPPAAPRRARCASPRTAASRSRPDT